jgi:hypothetical protein
MAQPPGKPPSQQQRPPARQQRQPGKQQQKPQQDAKARQRPAERTVERPQIREKEAEQSGLKAEETVVVAGTGGAKNLRYDFIDVWLPEGKPAYMIVHTAPGNQLKVELEQRSWKKSYAGNGSVKTDVVPIAPIGTVGTLFARDVTTGEELKATFHWGPIKGPSLLARLAKLIKSLFVSTKS